MDTREFLSFVLPKAGLYFSATPLAKKGFKHKACKTAEQVAEESLRLSEAGKNAFFACASFASAGYVDEFGKKHYRTQDNAISARAQWLDIDCGNEEYPTKKHGLTDLKRFLTATGLRRPNLIVSSGNGLHLYWVFEEDVPKAMWVKAAQTFKAICKALDFAQTDTSRTADIASVLRPVGTINDKSAKGRGVTQVELLGTPLGQLWSFREWVGELVRIKEALRVAVPRDRASAPQRNVDLTAGTEYPTSYAERIAERCRVLQDMRDTLGAEQTEPLWYQTLGVLAFCEDGEDKAQAWSQGHEGYDAQRTVQKLTQRRQSAGPTTCTKMADLSSLCTDCPYAGKITSPIVLGRVDKPQQTEELVEAPEGVRVEALPELPERVSKRFRWSEGLLWGKDDDDWVPICGQYPIMDYAFWCRDDSAFKYHIRARVRPGVWREGDIHAKNVASGGSALLGEMGALLGVCPRGAGNALVEYMRTWAEVVQSQAEDMQIHTHVGWYPDGGFLLGNRKYSADGTVKEVKLSEAMQGYVRGFDIEGDLDRYCELIDFAYNRKYHQAYQFTWLAAFASPLLRLVTKAPVGIPLVAWSKESGYGKTTAAHLALSVYGNPVAANQCISANKTTEYAMWTLAGIRRDVPMVLDEATLWEPMKLAKFAYDYSDGRPKNQGKASGGLRDNSDIEWSNFILVNANSSAVDAMSNSIINAAPMIARVWEYRFTLDHDQTMTMVDGARTFDELKNHYGVAGDAYLRYLVPNAQEVREQIFAVKSKLEAIRNVRKDARNWVLTAAVMWVAFNLTAKLGFHSFEKAPFRDYLLSHIQGMATAAEESVRSTEDLFTEMLNDIQSGLIVTINAGDRRTLIEAVFADKFGPPRTAITGRIITEEKKGYLSQVVVRKWCAKHGVPFNEFRRNLIAKGWVAQAAQTMNLAKGTPIVSPPVTTLVLNLEAIGAQLSLVGGKVVEPVKELKA